MTSEDGKSQWVVEFIYARTRQRSEIERLAGGVSCLRGNPLGRGLLLA